LPGVLLRNSNQKFICKNVYIKNSTGKALKIPIAHGEGRYYASEEVLQTLQNKNQVIYRYCTADGDITEDSNPNGTLQNIAGICNDQRTVFGMMPHPERACSPLLHNTDGLAVFNSLFGLS
jgi:phosphoribosylformylglycinamidine synthase